MDLGPWRWSALNMGFVGKWPSRMLGQWFFRNRAGGQQFSVGYKKSQFFGWAIALARIFLPRKVHGGNLTYPGDSPPSRDPPSSYPPLLCLTPSTPMTSSSWLPLHRFSALVFKIEALIWISFWRALKFQRFSSYPRCQCKNIKKYTRLVLNLCMNYILYVSSTM